jgi:hypothetical protein
MGEGAVAEATLQRHGEPEAQPPDLGGGQIRVGQQRRDRRQQPTDPVGFVAEQGRPAQVEDGGEGEVGGEGHVEGARLKAKENDGLWRLVDLSPFPSLLLPQFAFPTLPSPPLTG